MSKNTSKLQIAQGRAEEAAKRVNERINELGNHTDTLYKALNTIQSLFDRIRNIPEENRLEYERVKAIRLNWKQQSEKIQAEYEKSDVKAAGKGAVGVGVSVAVAALGPTAAMGIATTFGVASTGTAISALSGAAATNAALAWLGGGALATGGGGMAAGSAFLALAGPVGWAIAGASVAISGFMILKNKYDKERLENIYTLVSEREERSYRLADLDIQDRTRRIRSEVRKLRESADEIKTFGTDYSSMTVNQQYKLGTYYNLMKASTMLLVKPIMNLQPKYTEQDFEKLYAAETGFYRQYLKSHKGMVISMANLLYKITLDDEDKELLSKSLRKNKEFLSSINMSESDFGTYEINMVERALRYRYRYGTC